MQRLGNRVRRLVVPMAVLLCALLWARVVHTLVAMPPPLRALPWFGAEGDPLDEKNRVLYGPSLVVGDALWRLTLQARVPAAGPLARGWIWWAARLDPRQGRVEVRWPLESSQPGIPIALHGLEGDGAMVAVLIPNPGRPTWVRPWDETLVLEADAAPGRHTQFHRLTAEGGNTALPSLPGYLVGFEVVADRLEAVLVTDDNQIRLAWIPLKGSQWKTRTLTPFALQGRRDDWPIWADRQVEMKDGAAFRDPLADAQVPGDGWSVWTLAPGPMDSMGRVGWEIWRLGPEGTWRAMQTLKPDDSTLYAPPTGYTAPTYRLVRSPGVLSWHTSMTWLLDLSAGRWTARGSQATGSWENSAAIPPAPLILGPASATAEETSASFLSHLAAAPDRIRAVLEDRQPEDQRLGLRYARTYGQNRIGFERRERGWALFFTSAHTDGTFLPEISGPPLTVSPAVVGAFDFNDGEGGGWLLNSEGESLHVDAHLARDDLPTLSDRIQQWTERLASPRAWRRLNEPIVQIATYVEVLALDGEVVVPRWRLAIIPIGLAGLPLLLLLLGWTRRLRRWAWPGLAILWAALALTQFGWLWRALGPLWL